MDFQNTSFRKKIVILGGGTGGLVAANQLRKALQNDTDIVLVDRDKNHLFNPSLLWLMVGLRSREKIQRPLSRLQRKGIRFINASVQRIDFDDKIVHTSEGSEPFDYLVIALGASTFPEKIPGFSEAAYNLYDLTGAERLKKAIENFNKGHIVILISSPLFKCPAAPYEAALLLASYFTKKNKYVNITIATPETLPMGVSGPEAGNMMVSLLHSKGIHFKPQHEVVTIDPVKKEIVFHDNEILSYDLLIGIPPHGLPHVMEDSPILAKDGWVKVNPKTLETDIENIYAIGDVTTIPLPVGKPLPKAGVFAHFQADVVASNIASKIKGTFPTKEYEGMGYCIFEIGDGKAGCARVDFYAEPKPFVNMKKPGRLWHWGKILFEKWWLWKWF